MKTIIKTTAWLLGSLAILAACEDDREANPTLLSPTTFVLSTPSLSEEVVDLQGEDPIPFAWQQPAYGTNVAAVYELQFSPSNQWTVSVDKALADASGNTVPTFGQVGGQKSTLSVNASREEIAKVLQRCMRWSEAAVPASQRVFVRCMAAYNGDTIYSNTVEMMVHPHFVQLTNAAPNYWYLVGATIGDGSWGNTADGVGKGLMPLYPVEGAVYDSKTGDGVLSWTGYLTTEGFKLIHKPGSWDEQGGSKDGQLVMTGNSDNISVAAPGLYTVTVDTRSLQLTVQPYTGSSTVFPSMFVRGDLNAWGTTSMKAVSTFAGAQNHDWSAEVTIAADGGLKFDALGDWTTSWGAKAGWPFGTAMKGSGDNIPAKAGTYFVLFNDMTGQYNFFPKE